MEHKLDVGDERFWEGIMYHVGVFDLEIALLYWQHPGDDIKNEWLEEEVASFSTIFHY